MATIDNNNSEASFLKKFVAIFLLFLFALWGTGWDIFPGLSLAGLWYLSIILLLIFSLVRNQYLIFPSDSSIYIILIIAFALLSYSLYGLLRPNSQYSSLSDLIYLFLYDFKFLVAILSILIFYNYFTSLKVLEFSIAILSISFFIISLYLHWKYYYVFGVNYLGVIVDETGPSRAGKNSLGVASALIFPYLMAYFFSKKSILMKFYGLLGLLGVITLAINLQSRMMILMMISGTAIFFLYYSFRKSIIVTTILLVFLISISSIIFTMSSTSNSYYSSENFIRDYVFKINRFEEETEGRVTSYDIAALRDKPYQSYEMTEGGLLNKFLFSHRGWLLREGYKGFVDSAFLGEGVGTFRIRKTNYGSKTESHNDYVLLLYEQGFIGFFALLSLLIYRMRRTISLRGLFPKNYYLAGSLGSLFALTVALMFVNLYQTQVFWVIIALNILITEKFFNINKLTLNN